VTAAPETAPEVRRPRPVRGYASGKEDYLRRLRKIEGRVRGLQKMIEAGTWCPDVVTQVASATKALQEVAAGLLNDHIAHCVTATAARSPDEADARLAEVAATIRQVIRLCPWPAAGRRQEARRPACRPRMRAGEPAGSRWPPGRPRGSQQRRQCDRQREPHAGRAGRPGGEIRWPAIMRPRRSAGVMPTARYARAHADPSPPRAPNRTPSWPHRHTAAAHRPGTRS